MNKLKGKEGEREGRMINLECSEQKDHLSPTLSQTNFVPAHHILISKINMLLFIFFLFI
ncbi:hypothetical protein Lalb_Chr22g0351801 [Lupinus albus]|uniref:Uncharacterized protein n=1 Tax=Lupinus albus TaxID=3870 RepID=A0A6A4NF92_LUPAL|nr:hypothetical protein Lalb_Chr22g0351801 [Lupinus albus]